MTSKSKLLDKRGQTHGPVEDQARMSEDIKNMIHSSENWEMLHPVMKQSLDMIALKISRILEGDPMCSEHWEDLAGYPTLVIKFIEREEEVI